MKQTAVEWLVNHWKKLQSKGAKMSWQQIIDITELAKQMDRQQQDTFAIEFAEWYENDVLAKGDYEMITKDKKELLEIFKETYEQQ